jgi:hypothetical protein
MCLGSDIREPKASSLLQDSDLPNIDFIHIEISNQRIPGNMWMFFSNLVTTSLCFLLLT